MSMKAYVVVTGVIFGLITLAHIARMVSEGPPVATDPWYWLLTVVTALLSVWAWRVLRGASIERPARPPG